MNPGNPGMSLIFTMTSYSSGKAWKSITDIDGTPLSTESHPFCHIISSILQAAFQALFSDI